MSYFIQLKYFSIFSEFHEFRWTNSALIKTLNLVCLEVLAYFNIISMEHLNKPSLFVRKKKFSHQINWIDFSNRTALISLSPIQYNTIRQKKVSMRRLAQCKCKYWIQFEQSGWVFLLSTMPSRQLLPAWYHLPSLPSNFHFIRPICQQ